MTLHVQANRAKAPAIWTFITADVLAFALFFTLFMLQRRNEVALFDRSSAQLDASLGMMNTLILVTSSRFVALGVHAARQGQRASPTVSFWSHFHCGKLSS